MGPDSSHSSEPVVGGSKRAFPLPLMSTLEEEKTWDGSAWRVNMAGSLLSLWGGIRRKEGQEAEEVSEWARTHHHRRA